MMLRQGGAKRKTRNVKSMEPSNQFFEASIFASKTVKRLQREGHSADDAKRMVVAVINAEEFAVMTGRHSFDVARCVERLRQLAN